MLVREICKWLPVWAILAIADSSPAGGCRLDVGTGTAFNLPTPVWIDQSGWARKRVGVDFSTRPFEVPLYYAVRLAKSDHRGAWELLMVHHKLYSEDPPSPIQWLSATHGFNILALERAERRRTWIYRLGGGLVVTHPESTIRSRRFDEKGGLLGRGYYPSGPVAVGSVAKVVSSNRGYRLSLEAEGTVAYCWMPIYGGSLHAFVVSFHLRAALSLPLPSP